ncbi:MAG: alpha/beta hydrolase [Chloroflexi bacterium]|nr:alpha/beta hydrolase [Chloroflexota bacterium]MCC6891896.1 alpha/beta hydrolase [Anaerolineae bacterium]
MTVIEQFWRTYPDWRGNAPHTVVGELRVLPALPSPQLGNQRDIFVLLPSSYHTGDKRYPVIYMHDGQNLFDRGTGFAGQEWEVDETLSRLASEGIEVIIVGIANTDKRFQEYNPFPQMWNGSGDSYLAFMIDTLKPIIDRDFRTLTDRDHTGTIGSSMGGLISLYAFFQRPDVFGFAGVMSPAFWIAGGAIYPYTEQRPLVEGKIYLDNGTREQSARRMKQILVGKGYRLNHDLIHVVEQDGEHNEAAWARRLPDALRFLLKDTSG